MNIATQIASLAPLIGLLAAILILSAIFFSAGIAFRMRHGQHVFAIEGDCLAINKFALENHRILLNPFPIRHKLDDIDMVEVGCCTAASAWWNYHNNGLCYAKLHKTNGKTYTYYFSLGVYALREEFTSKFETRKWEIALRLFNELDALGVNVLLNKVEIEIPWGLLSWFRSS